MTNKTLVSSKGNKDAFGIKGFTQLACGKRVSRKERKGAEKQKLFSIK
jgi:hypothetical protein